MEKERKFKIGIGKMYQLVYAVIDNYDMISLEDYLRCNSYPPLEELTEEQADSILGVLNVHKEQW